MRTKSRVISKDRLRNLPEDVLLRIISFMMRSPKEACRTSILSRYWRPLWTLLPDVYFYFNPTHSPQAYQSFSRFVSRVLDSRKSKGLAIRKLKFDVFLRYLPIILDSNLISTWIRAAIDCHVQNLHFEINVDFFCLIEVPVPISVFNSDTITTLKLISNFEFTPSPVWLPSLKTLFFCNPFIYCDEIVRCFLSSCPNLEVFELDGTHDLITISAPKLKKLSARFQKIDFGAKRLEIIDAASLEYLCVRDFFPKKYVIEKSLDNVVEAKLTIMVDWMDMACLFTLFRALANVKSLFLCLGIRRMDDHAFDPFLDEEIQLGSLEELWDGYLPQFDNLVHLEFDEVCQLDIMSSFLRKSPNLESLVIERHGNADGRWAQPEEVPQCLLTHLTHFCYRGHIYSPVQFETVKYFVKNSTVLKTATIRPSMPGAKMMSYVRTKLCAKLEKIPRGSTSCQLIVESTSAPSNSFSCSNRPYFFG